MNLLAVDDQVNVVNGLAAGIDWESIGISHVYKACSAAEARNVFRNHPVDLLLCDIEMPAEDGFGLLEWAREQGYQIECIFLTAHADFAYARTALQMDSFDYILKPARYSEIAAAVERAAAKLARERQLNRLARVGEAVEKSEPDIRENDLPEEQGEDIKQRIAQVKRYIAMNLDRDLRRDEIADHVHLNASYLSRLFTRLEGISLKEYMIQEKMRTARDLIRTTRLSISIIAARVGYTSFSYFSQTYRQVYGISPSDERKTAEDGG